MKKNPCEPENTLSWLSHGLVKQLLKTSRSKAKTKALSEFGIDHQLARDSLQTDGSTGVLENRKAGVKPPDGGSKEELGSPLQGGGRRILHPQPVAGVWSRLHL